MLAKTKGIVLKQIKYSDKSNIVTVLTRDFGKKSFLVYGINSRTKGKLLRNILQPMFIVNLEFYYKETQTLGKIKELSLAYPYKNIILNFNKKATLIFLSEVVDNALMEHFADQALFDFVCNALKLFDEQIDNYVNFNLAFLAGFMKFLGIEPVNNFDEHNCYFSIPDGTFKPVYVPQLSFSKAESQYFGQLLQAGLNDYETLSFNRQIRNGLLHKILGYYQYHIDNFGKINSLDVLHEFYDTK